jgi:hypothetical protein
MTFPITLWRLAALRDVECVLTTHPAGFQLRVLRGPESEFIWTHVITTLRDAAPAAALMRERLQRNGWVLIDCAGEQLLKQELSMVEPAA